MTSQVGHMTHPWSVPEGRVDPLLSRMHGIGEEHCNKEKVLLSPEDGQELLVKQKPSDVLHM